ncbi:MAG: phosphatase PAP2 family protein [Ignavibacterium sp.]|nr:MAG: phosphatase PAP2 family protein [Ignavibacterium sp.]
MHESNPHKHNHTRLVYSYEKERQKKIAAYALLLTGVSVFILTLTGFTDGISEWTHNFLLEKLGYMSKWSERFGPKWFVHFVDDVAALGGKVIFFMGVTLTAVYYRIRKEHKLLWEFLIVVCGAVMVMISIKLFFVDETPFEPVDLLISSIAEYPSGHAMIAMVYYLTIAVLLTRRQRREIVRRYTIISATVIIASVGISRILGPAHTVTEVLAGWSLGLIWLCLCWLTERYLEMKFDLSKSQSHNRNSSS